MHITDRRRHLRPYKVYKKKVQARNLIYCKMNHEVELNKPALLDFRYIPPITPKLEFYP